MRLDETDPEISGGGEGDGGTKLVVDKFVNVEVQAVDEPGYPVPPEVIEILVAIEVKPVASLEMTDDVLKGTVIAVVGLVPVIGLVEETLLDEPGKPLDGAGEPLLLSGSPLDTGGTPNVVLNEGNPELGSPPLGNPELGPELVGGTKLVVDRFVYVDVNAVEDPGNPVPPEVTEMLVTTDVNPELGIGIRDVWPTMPVVLPGSVGLIVPGPALLLRPVPVSGGTLNDIEFEVLMLREAEGVFVTVSVIVVVSPGKDIVVGRVTV